MERKVLVGTLLLGICLLGVNTVRADWIDDFESYNIGDANGQGPWIDFGGRLTTDISNAQAKSGTKSLALSLDPTDGGNSYGSDVYLVALNNGSVVTTGQWTLSYQMYIPAANKGELEMYISQTAMVDFQEGAWMQADANSNLLKYGNSTDTAALVRDRWVEVKLAIDLDADTVTAYYDGTAFHTDVWDKGAPATPSIGGINFWADGSKSGLTGTCYFDDFSLTPEPSTLALLGIGGLLLRRRRKT